MIKVEKGIPMPTRGRGASSKYPWHDMDVGDSFAAPMKDPHQAAATASMRQKPKRFLARKIEGGYRIWRIE